MQALKRLEETEGDVGAFLSVQGRAAVDTARAIDRKVRYAPFVTRRVFSFIGGAQARPGLASFCCVECSTDQPLQAEATCGSRTLGINFSIRSGLLQLPLSDGPEHAGWLEFSVLQRQCGG